MIERLAIPAWNAPPTSLDAWLSSFRSHGHEPSLVKEAGMTWLEVAPLRLRAFVVFDGEFVEALNFELHDRQPDAALALIEAVAASLQWEVHDETDDDDEDV